MCIKTLQNFILLIYVTIVAGNSLADYKRLYDNLEKNIDVRFRPVLNGEDTLDVLMIPSLISIQGLDEKAQVLRSTLVLILHWKYETLKWAPELYGNISLVHFSPDSIWLPDLAYQNSVGESFELKRLKTMKVGVKSNGEAMWPNGANLETFCRVDVTKYPYDTQRCTILIGKGYSYDYEIMMKPQSNKIDISAHTDNDEWKLLDTNIRYKKLFDQMTFVELEIVLQRRPLFYVLNTISPIILLSLLNVFSFKLPISSGERVSYCISLFLTFIVLLNMICDSMPEVSQNVSYLQLYVNIQLFLGMVTTTVSVFLVQTTEKSWIVKFYYNIKRCKSKNKVKSLHILQNQEEWKEGLPQQEKSVTKNETTPIDQGDVDKMAAVQFIDTVCFWSFLGLFIMTTLITLMLMIA